MAQRRTRRKRFFTPDRRRDLGVVLLLLLGVLPGLYVMWTRTNWKQSVKTAVSLVSILVVIGIILPLTTPPERRTGGVVLVGKTVETEVYGPEAPANRTAVEVYTPVRTAIVLEPTAEPEPIIVYCNNGGKYYHAADCKWVKPTTPTVTLSRALDAGYTRCPDCDAPESTGY